MLSRQLCAKGSKGIGFTGESMVISTVSKESSTAYAQEYTPRARVTMNEIADCPGLESIDFELSHSSTILSVDATYSNDTGVASGQFTLKKHIENLPDLESWVLGRCSNPEKEWMAKPNLFAVWIQT